MCTLPETSVPSRRLHYKESMYAYFCSHRLSRPENVLCLSSRLSCLFHALLLEFRAD